jgi:nitrate reductase gamma subunit
MNVLISLLLVAGLFVVGMFGPGVTPAWVFAVVIPYAAVTLFVVGLAIRVMGWAGVPVPSSFSGPWLGTPGRS